MISLIRLKVKECLSEYKISLGDIEIGIPKKKSFGDYTTNILLKNQIKDYESFIEKMMEDDFFASVEYVNGFINIFISTKINEIKEVDTKISLKEEYLYERMKNIVSILDSENLKFAENKFTEKKYILIIKRYNMIVECIKENISVLTFDDLLLDFKSFDEDVFYRKLKSSELAEIRDFFKCIIFLIERTRYE